MGVEDRLQQLRAYYESTRGVGHTETLKKGTDNVDEAFVLVHSYSFGRQIAQGREGIRPITLDSLDKLRGSRLPLVWDNAATHQVLSQALGEIHALQREIDRLQEEA